LTRRQKLLTREGHDLKDCYFSSSFFSEEKESKKTFHIGVFVRALHSLFTRLNQALFERFDCRLGSVVYHHFLNDITHVRLCCVFAYR